MRTAAVTVFITAFFVSFSLSDVLYVDHAASGAHDGTSWSDAYVYLQDALSAATVGDSVWVAAGTYYPDEGAGQTDDDRASTFDIPDGVVVLGGFDGSETAVGQRDWEVNTAELNGDIDQTSDSSSNAYHVVTFTLVGEQTELNGFTVSRGNADGMAAAEKRGGGIYCDASGAGSVNKPRIINCTITGNYGTLGAGLHGTGENGGESSPVLTNCTVSGNIAGSGGGGLFIRGENGGICQASLNNCTISGNEANTSGGIGCYGSYDGTASPTITNCTFTGNRAQRGGGFVSDAFGGTADPMLTNCAFTDNAAMDGGGIFVQGQFDGLSSPTLINCTVRGDSAGSSGGGVYCRAYTGTCTPVLTNCVISGNSAWNGGGLYTFGHTGASTPLLTNCTIAGNYASGHGGGLNCTDHESLGTATLINCIVWGNGVDQVYSKTATPSYTHSCVQGSGGSGAWDNTFGTDNGGNIDADPLFVTPVSPGAVPSTHGDLRLGAYSSCIDAAAAGDAPALDVLGNARFDDLVVANSGSGSPPFADIGAYERQTVSANSAPTIDPIDNPPAIHEGAGEQTIALSGISDGDGGTQSIAVTAISGSPAVIPSPVVSYTSPQATGSLRYTPAPDAFGSVTVTVRLQDNGGTSEGGVDTLLEDFTVTIEAVNDAPGFTEGADVTVNEDCGAQTVDGWASGIAAGPSNESSQTLSFTCTTDNDALFGALPAVAPSTGALSFTPAADAHGTATVSVSLTDDGGTERGGVDSSGTRTFTVTVEPVNDPPLVDGIGDQTIDEGGSFATVALDTKVSDIDNTPEQMDWRYGGNGELIVSIDPASRIATVEAPSDTWHGSETIVFTAADPDGREGADGALFTVRSTNEPPELAAVNDTTVAPGETWELQLQATDPDEDTLTYELRQGPGGLQLEESTGMLAWTPGDTDTGAYAVTVGVLDGEGGDDSVSFAIRVERAVAVRETRSTASATSRPFAAAGELLASPNPARRGESMSFLVRASSRTATLTIYSAGSRLLYEKEYELRPGPTRDARLLLGPWALTDNAGRLLPAGTYLAQVESRDELGNAVRYRILVGVKR